MYRSIKNKLILYNRIMPIYIYIISSPEEHMKFCLEIVVLSSNTEANY